MIITLCASLNFVDAIHDIARELSVMGHEVFSPLGAEMVRQGTLSQAQIIQSKEEGDFWKITAQNDAIKHHYAYIKKSDAIVVLNLDKKGIANYIGGNTFLEMGFAHVLEKKIFLLNDIPDLPYADEIRVMKPIILHGNLNAI